MAVPHVKVGKARNWSLTWNSKTMAEFMVHKDHPQVGYLCGQGEIATTGTKHIQV